MAPSVVKSQQPWDRTEAGDQALGANLQPRGALITSDTGLISVAGNRNPKTSRNGVRRNVRSRSTLEVFVLWVKLGSCYSPAFTSALREWDSRVPSAVAAAGC